MLEYAISCDRYENPFSKRILMVSCLDQVPQRFPVTVGGSLVDIQYDEIPNEIGAVISFEPNYPSPPHTEEQHNYIETFNDKLKLLMERECLRLRG